MLLIGKDLDKIRLLCNIAKQHGLYTDDGFMRGWYYKPEELEAIVIYKRYSAVIGAAAIHKKDVFADHGIKVNCGIFVLPQFRKNGIGYKLALALKKNSSKKLLFYNFGYRKLFAAKAGL